MSNLVDYAEGCGKTDTTMAGVRDVQHSAEPRALLERAVSGETAPRPAGIRRRGRRYRDSTTFWYRPPKYIFLCTEDSATSSGTYEASSVSHKSSANGSSRLSTARIAGRSGCHRCGRW